MTKVRSINSSFIAMYLSGITGFAIALVFILITGIRNIDDFLELHIGLIIAIAIVMLLTVISFIYNLKNHLHELKKDSYHIETHDDYSHKRKSDFIVFSSFLISFALNMLGLFVSKYFKGQAYEIIELIFLITASAVLILLPLNAFGLKCYNIYIYKEPWNYWQAYYNEKRAKFDSEKKNLIASIVLIKVITNIYIVILSILGILLAFSLGVIQSTSDICINIFLTAFPIMAVLSRFKFNQAKSNINPENLIHKEDYPALFEIVNKAAYLSSCNKNVKVTISSGFSSSIAELDDCCIIDIGALLLEQCSEDELLCVLLHEFEHVSLLNKDREYAFKYQNWMQKRQTAVSFHWITDIFFLFFDTIHCARYKVFDYASSIQRELTADTAMLKSGMPDSAASALIKIHFYDKYKYHERFFPQRNEYSEEKPNPHPLHDESVSFGEFISNKYELLIEMAKKEIPMPTASHPILRERLAVLGLDEYSILNNKKAPSFEEEAEKAMNFIEDILYKFQCKDYEKERKSLYIEPKKLIDKWIESDKHIDIINYMDIVSALITLRLYDEIYEQLDILLESDYQDMVTYANYIKGCFLLHQFNPDGIELLNEVIENSEVLSFSAITEISHFCCIFGDAKGLAQAQKRAIRNKIN